jgi:hypothetical protein
VNQVAKRFDIADVVQNLDGEHQCSVSGDEPHLANTVGFTFCSDVTFGLLLNFDVDE